MINGVLCVDKPRGLTSHDVVEAVRRCAGLQAVGHTGTLDPDASGLLLLCLGRATKFAQFFEALEKTYWAVMRLGVCTDTQDATGKVTRRCPVPPLSREQLKSVLRTFTGHDCIAWRGKVEPLLGRLDPSLSGTCNCSTVAASG
jgi:tRNA pseudouridine55 synthase